MVPWSWRTAAQVALLASGSLLLLGADGCSSEDVSCTLIGCEDQLTLEVTQKDGTWPPGEYDVRVTYGGQAVTCRYQWAPQAGTLWAFADCGPLVSLHVSPRTVCEHRVEGQAVVQQCEPVPGQFIEYLTVRGTPSAVAVRHRLNGTVLDEREVRATYEAAQPNGVGCGPICQQASAAIILP
jgi:hypothetical protein